MPLTSTDDASDDSKKGKQLLDLCCRGRFLVSMLASKNPIFCWFCPVCLSFLIQSLAWLGSNISRRMRRVRFKISATGCRVVQKELVDQPPSHQSLGWLRTHPPVCQVQTQLVYQMNQIFKHPNILLQLLRVPPMLMELAVVELKDQEVLPFDWCPFNLCLSQPRRSWERNCLMIRCCP